MIRVRSRASGGVALLTLAFFALAASGCLSNEYEIRKDELRRLAALAPEARGQSVRVSQSLGERRSDAVSTALPEAPVEADETSDTSTDVDLRFDGGLGGPNRAPPHGAHGPPSRAFGGVSEREFHGTPPGGLAGPPAGGGHTASGGFHGTPSGGGGGLSLPSGKDGSDALVLLVVVAIVGAAVATVALAASEGARFEGHAAVAPQQLVYLKDDMGTHAVPLAELSPEQAASADSALVMDDEGYGLLRLDHAPLDRKGGVFRFDLGAGTFNLGDARASGVGAHIQTGYYFTHTLGLVFDLSLGAGTPDSCCAGTADPTVSMSRISYGLEAQALPLALGPLHLGAFAGGGLATGDVGGTTESGPLASGGALLEVDLTSRMAFVVRGGASRAWLPSGVSSAGTITGGFSIY